MTDNQNNNGRDFAVLVGGVAAGILGTRLLPPLLASASGAIRAKRSGDPFKLLIQDHRRLVSILAEMEKTPQDSMGRRNTLFLMFKRKLAKHALAEEDVVYPLLHDEDEQGQSRHLYHEHADMKILLYQVEESLLAGTDWKAPVACLQNLITSHIQDEEQNVFPKMRQVLDKERRARVSGMISMEESLIL
jgi:hemerythrin superfamily protein